MNILIVDDRVESIEIMEYIVKSIFPTNTIIHTANSGNCAIERLKISKIDLCLCDHNMENGMGNIVLKYIIDANIKTKFVLCSSVHPIEFPNFYPPKHMFFNIQKPDLVLGIENLYRIISNDYVDSDDSNDFIPITPELLLHLGITPDDIYIRISENKFVKCLNKNTAFDLVDLVKYQSKSLRTLFILKENEQKSVTKIISSGLSSIMSNSELSLNSRMSIIHSQISEMIKSQGMNSGLAQITKKNIKQTVSIILKTNFLDNFWDEIEFMGEYPSDLFSLHTLLASAIVKKLIWNTEQSIFKLTIAAFLQDATMNSASLLKVYNYRHFIEIEKDLEKDEAKKYLEHPKATKKIISFFKNIPSEIDRIFYEQHEMPNGTGFPNNKNADMISSLSCVFIVSGILARYILNEGPKFQLSNFIKEFEIQGYNKGNFKESFSVLKNMQVI